MLAMNGRRHWLWWSGKGDRVMMNKDLCVKVVDVRGVSDRVMTVVVVVFGKDVLRMICRYAQQSGRSWEEK